MATEAGTPRPLPSRVPNQLCLSTRVRVGDGLVPILRAQPGPALSIDGRTLLVAVISDAGDLLEVVYAENLGRYNLLSHRIGETILLGGFDGVPSDAQIGEILNNPESDAARPRVPVSFSSDGRMNIYLPELPASETEAPST